SGPPLHFVSGDDDVGGPGEDGPDGKRQAEGEGRELDGQTTCDAHKLPPERTAYEPGRSQNVRESVPPQLRFAEVPGHRTVSQIELAIDDTRIRCSRLRLF